VRILLLRSPVNRRLPLVNLSGSRQAYPLRLAYIAAELEDAGATVSFLDCPRKGYDRHAAAGAVFQAHPDVVYTELDHREARAQLRFLDRLKELSPLRIVLGGAYAATLAEVIVGNFPAVEAVTLGEPDLALTDMVEQWSDGAAVARIPGLVTRIGKRAVVGPDRPPVTDLDRLPFPDREIVPFRHYQGGWLHQRPMAVVAGTRGCPRACRFCRRGSAGGAVRYRSPGNVAVEVEELVRRDGVREIRFVDAVFNADPRWCLAVAEAVMPMGVTWHCTVSASALTAEQLRAFRRAGCRDVFLSPVCPTEESAAALGVEDGPAAVRTAIELAAREDVNVHVKVITGEAELPPLAQAYAFAASLSQCMVTIRQIQPQIGSALAPQIPNNLAPAGESRDVRRIVGFSKGQVRFWRERVRTLIHEPKRELCAEVGPETFN
jgi:radical SAM superfamily enzyme YgiQ (UPF0313 family)